MLRSETRTLVLYALFTALIFVLALTPIGYINVGAIEITIIHIPVIIGSFILGVKGGLVLGFMFGLSSLIRAIMVPTPLAVILLGMDTGFGLYNLVLIVVILFIPRILVGLFSALLYKLLSVRHPVAGSGVAAAVGSLTNTVLFLGFLYILAAPMLAAAFGTTVAGVVTLLFTTTALINGSIELAAAVAISVATAKALSAYISRHSDKSGPNAPEDKPGDRLA